MVGVGNGDGIGMKSGAGDAKGGADVMDGLVSWSDASWAETSQVLAMARIRP